MTSSALNIVHVNEYASVARTLADAQNRLGHHARVLAGPHPGVAVPDVALPDSHNTAAFQAAILRHADLRHTDIFHVHGGIWRSHLIWPALKVFAQKPLVLHLHGSETRTGKGLHYLRRADHIFVSTPDLRKYVPASTWLPDPAPLPADRSPDRKDGKVIVGHFPSKPEVKGTRYVVGAFRDLHADHVAELLLVQNVTHNEALRLMDRCDIVVDQVNDLGVYGVVAIEAAARWKVVLTSHDPALYPMEVPMVPVTRSTIRKELERWIYASPQDRERMSERARAFAERVHGPAVAAESTVKTYEGILARRT